jgi:hypothetical protein
MCGAISLLPTYTSMVWTGINVVVVVVLFTLHSCIGGDSTEQPQLIALITDKSHFTEFLFAPFCFNPKIYTTFKFTQ